MKRGTLTLAALSALSGAFTQPPPFAMRAWRSTSPRKHVYRRNTAGTKLQRKAEAGVLTMRAPGGVVSQLYRELQQRAHRASHQL